jgi:hypothetical protein
MNYKWLILVLVVVWLIFNRLCKTDKPPLLPRFNDANLPIVVTVEVLITSDGSRYTVHLLDETCSLHIGSSENAATVNDQTRVPAYDMGAFGVF